MTRVGTWTLVTRQASLILILGCGDNLPGRPDAALIDALIDARTDAPIDAPLGLPFVELSPVSGYNQASETLVAAHGNNVVVVTTEQDFPSADSFAYPTNADADPNHPFRKLIYSTSHDRGDTFSTSTVLIDASRTDPLLAVRARV